MLNKQKGLGMTEVMASIIVLTVGVASIVGVQLKAIDVSTHNLKKAEATVIAKDFIEMMRTNPTQIAVYEGNSINNTVMAAAGSGTNCYTSECSASDKAKHDVYQAYTTANDRGYALRTKACDVNSHRRCVYVSWGETNPTHGNTAFDCTTTVSGAMVVKEGAKCVVLEGM